MSICVYVASAATDIRKKVNADELIQIVAAAKVMPNAELAKELTGVALTDRLSSTRSAELMSRLPGEQSRMEITRLADESIFLPPSPDAMPDDQIPLLRQRAKC